jgi:tetratricopeptide (TPR) repeat protein
MRSLVACVLAFCLASVPERADACLWDYDTLKEESLGQAEVAAVIGGDLQKHSKTFYEAKIDYTRPLVAKADAKQARYDDLAVALAKLGKHDDAIAVLADKEKKFPGEYTTEANLGTFLAMKGDVAGALDHLKKAIAINPKAHFGREKFQLQLLEYLQRVAKDKTLAQRENFLGIKMDWQAHIGAISKRATRRPKASVPTAPVIALVGLMRFGDAHENPHVWHALGWALVEQGDLQLALRAWRRANVLGLPYSPDQGMFAAFVHEIGGKNPTDPVENQKAWDRLTKKADAEWAKGQAADERRRAAEDAKLAKQQLKAVFGY